MRRRTGLLLTAVLLTAIATPAALAQVPLPYSENFDGYTYNADMISNSSYEGCWENPRNYPNHTLPTGWDFPQMSLINNTNMSTTANMHPQFWMKNCDPHSLPHCFVFKAISSRPNAVAVLPATSAPASRIHIEFWYKNEQSGTQYTMEVGVITNAADSSTFRRLYTCPQTNTWTLISVDLYDYLGGTDYAAGTYRVALRYKNASGLGYRCAIDDLTLDEVDCFPPSQLTATDITTTSARLSWRDPHMAGRSYIVKNGTTTLGNTADTFFVASGLTPNTTYTLTVADICGKQTNVTFTTPCEAYPIPYSEGMDRYSTDISSTIERPSAYPNHTMPACWTFTGLNTMTTMGSLGEYTFSTGVDASKWKTLTAYTDISLSSGDYGATPVNNIGFSFPFGNASYTQFSVNTDGSLRLGGTQIGTNAYSSPFSSSNASTNNPKINAFGCDGYAAGGTHHIYKQTFGDTLTVVEICQGTYTSSTRNQQYTWQVHLYQNGRVEIVYSPNAPATNPATSFQVGLCVNAADGWIVSTSHSASHFTNGSSTNWGSGNWPGANRYYSWRPPARYPQAFLSTFNAHHQNCLTLINGSASDVSYSVLPELTGTPISNMQLDFWYRQSTMSSMVGELTVGTMVDPNDGSTFAPLYTMPRQVEWTRSIENLTDYHPAASARYIAFRYSGGLNGAEWTLIDSVQVRLACLPTESSESAVACDSYSWRGNTYTRSTPAPTFITTNAAGCDSVISLHLAINYDTLPYYEDFERYTAEGSLISTNTAAPLLYPMHTMPPCWRVLNLSFTKFTYPLSFITSHPAFQQAGSEKCLVMRSALSSNKLYFVMPTITAGVRGNLLKLAFKYNMNNANAGTLNFGVMTNPTNAGTYVNLKALDQTTSWISISDTIGNYSSILTAAGLDETPLYIAFRYDGQSSAYSTLLDDIVISALPCENPTNLTATNITATAVTLTWNDPNGGIIAHYLSLNGVRVATVPAGVSSYTLTGLTPGTSYTAEVSSPCATMPTSTSFSTPCSGTLPYVEAFDSYSSGTGTSYEPPAGYPNTAMPDCWLVPHKSATTSTYPQAFISDWSALRYVNKGFCVKTNPAQKDGHAIINIDFGVEPSTLVMTYRAYVNGYSRTEVGFVTDPYDTNTFVPLATMPANHSMASEDTLRLADHYASLPANTTVYFAFRAHNTVAGTGATPWGYLGLDSVKIFQFICPPTDSTMTVEACDSYTWIDGYSYTASTNTPTRTIRNHCGSDSTVTLHLTIKQSSTGDTTATECDHFTWHGTDYTASSTPTHTYTNAAGCDSTVTLTLTINQSSTGDTTATVCDQFTWHGIDYTASATPTHAYTNAAGCDSTVTLHLTVNHSNTGDTAAVVCDQFTWHGIDYASSATPTHTYTNASGCDSAVTLHLTVNHSNSGDTAATVCDQFPWHTVTYLASGTPTHIYTNAAGCDSTVTLHLTINHSNTGDTSTFECDHFTWHGINYTSTPLVAPTHTYTNAAGCDSIVTLHLTINHSNTGDTTATECDQFSWHTVTYTSTPATAPTHTYHTAAGCDSTVTLHLTINASTTGDTIAFECDQFNWHGINYTSTPSTEPTHTYTNTAGCDSIVRLLLTISRSTAEDTTVVACDSFTWHGETYTSTPLVAPTHSYTNAAGCSRNVTLHLTVNHSNTGDTTATACDRFMWYGSIHTTTPATAPTHTLRNAAQCDSTVSLHLTINHSNTGDTVAVVCDQFSWYGTAYSYSTTPTHTFTNAAGCDSIVTLRLIVHRSSTGDTVATACEQFTWHNAIYSASNTATHTYRNRSGCDSTVTLHLTISHHTAAADPRTACDRFIWRDGLTYTASTNTPTFTLTNAAGCDSILTLNLTIKSSTAATDVQTACNNYTWIDGQTYTADTSTATHTLRNAAGCDSVVTLNLTINRSSRGDTAATVCDRFNWYGNEYTLSTATATHTIANTVGCDSTITLNLTVNHSTTTTTSVSACDHYTWHGTNYLSSGVHRFDTLTVAGCDSTSNLDLTINHSSTGDTAATACDRFTWYGQRYSESTAATHLLLNAAGCDSTLTLHLTILRSTIGSEAITAIDSLVWHGTEYRISGAYRFDTINAVGCDSTATLRLTINHIYHSVTLTADPDMGIVYPERTSIVQHGHAFRAVATSLRGFRFIGWYSGNTPVSRDDPYSFVVTEDVSLTARFVPIDYLPDSLVVFFSVTNPALGTTNPAPGRHVYYYGDEIVANATLANGCYMDGWQVSGGVPGQSSRTFRLVVDSTLLGSILDVKAMIYADASVVFTIDASPFNSAMGEVIGAGQYLSGSTVTLIAVPYRGYKFTGWSNGSMDELLVFEATDDVSLVAYFASDGTLGIADNATDDFKVYAANGTIYVIGAEGKHIALYDINGRCLEHRDNTSYIARFTAHASGVYLVRAADLPAKRVVVIR